MSTFPEISTERHTLCTSDFSLLNIVIYVCNVFQCIKNTKRCYCSFTRSSEYFYWTCTTLKDDMIRYSGRLRNGSSTVNESFKMHVYSLLWTYQHMMDDHLVQRNDFNIYSTNANWKCKSCLLKYWLRWVGFQLY